MEPSEDQTPEEFLASEKLKRLHPPNPELENFISRATEISDVIHCLSSPDATLNERGLRKADILLHHQQQQHEAGNTSSSTNNFDAETASVQVTWNRSVINKIVDPDPNSKNGGGEGDMNTTTAFMRMVEKDANERAENRRIRKQHSDRYKDEGIALFRQQKYPEALCKFDKAIEWLKDSPVLYTNRAITYIKLEIYSKAITDCDSALRLSESCLKAKLYRAKALAAIGEIQDARQLFRDTKIEHPESEKLISGYETETFDKLA